MADESTKGWKIPKPDDASLQRGKNYLLTIGIDQYTQVARLNNAVRDAQAFVGLLLDKYRFQEDHVLTLYDEAATYAAIDQALRMLAQRVNETDSLILYFSGHGHFDEFLLEGYWLPVHARYGVIQDYLSYDYLLKAIRGIRTRHTFVIADSCYSGAVLVSGDRDLKSDPREKDPSRWLLASGRNEVVPDGQAGSQSPFAEQLLDILSRYAIEGIPVLSLVDKVTTATIHNGKQQPIGRPLHGIGDKGGQFIFHPKRNEVYDWQLTEEAHSLRAYELYLKVYPQGRFVEHAHWAIACLKDTPGAYDLYLEKFPQGRFGKEAEAKARMVESRLAWEKASRIHTPGSYRTFLSNYPQSEFAPEARKRREALRLQEEEGTLWAQAQREQKLAVFWQYLDKFPNGLHADAARQAIEKLEAQQALAAKQAEEAAQQLAAKQAEEQARQEALGRETAEEARAEEAEAERKEHVQGLVKGGKNEARRFQVQEAKRVDELAKKLQAADPPKAPQIKPKWMVIGGGAVLALVLLIVFWPNGPSYEALMARALSMLVDSNKVEAAHELFQQAQQIENTEEVRNILSKLEVRIDSLEGTQVGPDKDGTTAELSEAVDSLAHVPPAFSHRFRRDELRINITEGKPPFTLSLHRKGEEKYQQSLDSPARDTIILTEYREDPGEYELVVLGANGLKKEKTIKIDPPRQSGSQASGGSVEYQEPYRGYGNWTINIRGTISASIRANYGGGDWTDWNVSGIGSYRIKSTYGSTWTDWSVGGYRIRATYGGGNWNDWTLEGGGSIRIKATYGSWNDWTIEGGGKSYRVKATWGGWGDWTVEGDLGGNEALQIAAVFPGLISAILFDQEGGLLVNE